MLPGLAVGGIVAQHPGHIGSGFGNIGDGVFHPARAGVVGGETEGLLTIKNDEQKKEVFLRIC